MDHPSFFTKHGNRPSLISCAQNVISCVCLFTFEVFFPFSLSGFHQLMGALLSILFDFFLPTSIAPKKREKKRRIVGKTDLLMSSKENTSDVVKLLIERSRSSIEDGDKDDALASLLHAIRLTSGEASILGILDAAKKKIDEEYENRGKKSQIRGARDALEELLERSADSIIGERTCLQYLFLNQSSISDFTTNILLFTGGDDDILHDAFVDGSSVVCTKCGSLIARSRAEAHSLKWCPMLPQRLDSKEDDDDDDDD